MKRVVSFLLHAHLPYGLRPDLESSLEECWLHEAVTGCYLPLYRMIDRLEIPFQSPILTLSLSPTLLELWGHPEFQDRYCSHLARGITILEGEITDKNHSPERRLLASRLKTEWEQAERDFNAVNGQLARAFAKQAAQGRIELITTAATHAFLPAHQPDRAFRHFQIENGLATFHRHTNIQPSGFWLPECGYFPGLEEDLAAHGIQYFALEARGLNAAQPPVSCRNPLKCANGTLALGRNATLSEKVWSAQAGYPGHPSYREFHYDGIQDLAPVKCGPYALPDGGRLPVGLKYWRVTGSDEKDWYEPDTATNQAREHADDFVSTLSTTDKGLVFLPFDAELFGHWWYEGPHWLESVLTKTAALPDTLVAGAASACQQFTHPPEGRPAASTWGRNSDYSFWINHETDWLYPILRNGSEQLAELCRKYVDIEKSDLQSRGLRQAARELLLAGASDWPFMLRAGSTVDYAMQRLREHLGRFFYLLNGLQNESIDRVELELLEGIDQAFKEVSVSAYARPYPS